MIRKRLIGGPNCVYDVMVCKICSTCFFDKPLALLKFWIEPYAARLLEYNLFSLTFSDFERDVIPLSFALALLFNTNLGEKMICFQNSKVNIWKTETFSL